MINVENGGSIKYFNQLTGGHSTQKLAKIHNSCPSHKIFILALNTFLCSHKGLFTAEFSSLFFGALFLYTKSPSLSAFASKALIFIH